MNMNTPPFLKQVGYRKLSKLKIGELPNMNISNEQSNFSRRLMQFQK